ncbi:MAG TPA: hypothetical protein V6D20_15950 [Candidatus Obscuribacterales bacterium]
MTPFVGFAPAYVTSLCNITGSSSDHAGSDHHVWERGLRGLHHGLTSDTIGKQRSFWIVNIRIKLTTVCMCRRCISEQTYKGIEIRFIFARTEAEIENCACADLKKVRDYGKVVGVIHNQAVVLARATAWRLAGSRALQEVPILGDRGKLVGRAVHTFGACTNVAKNTPEVLIAIETRGGNVKAGIGTNEARFSAAESITPVTITVVAVITLLSTRYNQVAAKGLAFSTTIRGDEVERP